MLKKKKNIIALIPARGGSKALPKKNLQFLGKKSLLRRAIEVAKDCNFIDRVIVSTDDINIKQEAIKYGAEVYIRP